MSSENSFQRFLGRVPQNVFKPVREGGLHALLRAIDREHCGQCPRDDGARCALNLISNYQGPGCRNTACPKYQGKEGLLQILERGARQAQLLTAEGTYLDIWGSFLNVWRRDGENDDLFLLRIVNEAFAPRVTKAALLARIRPFYPEREAEVTIIEYERPFTADSGWVVLTDPADGPDVVLIVSDDGTVDHAAVPEVCPLAILADAYITDGRFDAFNEQLGLWPYQFAVYVPAFDTFAAGFVFSDAYALPLEDSDTTTRLDVGIFVQLDDSDHPEYFDEAHQNAFVYDLASWRRANASREVKELVRQNKAAGTQPLFRPMNTEIQGIVLG
ncbi:MAG: hypothetical protein HY816_19935 [Candidatus Wallbacteria bacterium]|nr:hypothetical protein [Candidatus Wallbacteria bacterium]